MAGNLFGFLIKLVRLFALLCPKYASTWRTRFLWISLPELSCRSKLASLSDKLNLLEKKVEFLEARVRLYF
ncbi:hypothetical protein Y032_0164g3548 [Ancylostoma ceylanicum]|uniref:Uncharacterized protein n=1 Tax=Ancylostoma ceylanicum TaxID=53326 RepID=A0A016SXN7_9BILA|nr:hypothetical protein Y032_0164g3548 [Ancylostoma ceylanicum]